MLDFDFSLASLESTPDEEKLSTAYDMLDKMRNGNAEFVFSSIVDSEEYLKKTIFIANKIKKRFHTLIVVGIGGSSLGTRTIINALKMSTRFRVMFMENVDPESISDVLKDISPSKTAVNFVSRSGTTLETIAQYFVLKQFFNNKIGKRFNEHFFITTASSDSFLAKEAEKHGYTIIDFPGELVGRYSVMSPVGLIPASFAGINIRMILNGARSTKEQCLIKSYDANPALKSAFINFYHYQNGKKTIVFMPYCDRLITFGEWFAQLWGESLGKINTEGIVHGQLPVRGAGTQDQHSLLQLYLDGPKDRLVIFVTSKHKNDIRIKTASENFEYLKGKGIADILLAEQQATAEALSAKGVPSFRIHIDGVNEFNLGGLFYFFEAMTVLMSAFLKVNPFDQPAVEDIKRRSKIILQSNTRLTSVS